MPSITFSFTICTHNRKDDLLFTLDRIRPMIGRPDTEILICDDGSRDGTYEAVRTAFPEVEIHRNETAKGYLVGRNRLLGMARGEFAISLDDDAHFLSDDPLEQLLKLFRETPDCGLIACRLWWSLEPVSDTATSEAPRAVKSFVGCGHVWRMEAWRSIPDYPEWFEFYGEEDFASYHLLREGWKVIYLPEVLVQHRVDSVRRKSAQDRNLRQRRSLRSGWYLYFLFFPVPVAVRKWVASVWGQLRNHLFKGNRATASVLFLATWDLLRHTGRIIRERRPLNDEQQRRYRDLAPAEIRWIPKDLKS